ncbi:oligopeptide transport system substrate-binding protein [Kushneria sinocarnis]|uniref:Oligopeptide transport system substrate-binding protein n=1 Tax=Kushneria sinocarnis TaxID=595502 RepID=A0A420WXM7_9GAMM|nr:peptide ABC transporter substrate-binding protein [Kushneria sinocarnis]RKR04495.1 oligopeptide transport system substrate-binding protein [Kushneria sinocarnis]
MRLTTLMGVGALCALLATGPLPAGAGEPDEAAVLHRANGAEPSSLDPQLGTGSWESNITGDLFEGLLARDAAGELIPGVAQRWDVSADGLTYTFHLRENARWSDGTPVTAGDFVYAWRRLLSPELGAAYAYLLFPVANARAINHGEQAAETLGVQAVDEHTLTVTLTRPTGYFPELLAHPSTFPVPEQAIRAHGSRWTQPGNMVSNGAFELTEWVSHGHITARRNADFHDAAGVSLQAVTYYPIDDARAALNRFRTGEMDMIDSVPTDRLDWARRSMPRALHVSPMLGTFYFAFNQREGSVLTDRRIREALNLATRRRIITERITRLDQPPAWSLVPDAIDHYDGPRFDFADSPLEERMARARQLMQDAGYSPAHPLKLTIDYITNPETRRIPVALAAMWQPLGVDVTLINSDAAVYYAKLRQGDFQIGMAPWVADYNDASNFLDLFRSGVPNNHSGYHHPAYDRLMAEAGETLDPGKRARLMADAEQRLLDDAALLPLYFYVRAVMVSPRLTGWQENPLDIHPSRWIRFRSGTGQ